MAVAGENYAQAYQSLLAADDAALGQADAANTAALNSDRDQYTADTDTVNAACSAALAQADHDQAVGYATADAGLTRDTTAAAAVRDYQTTQADAAYQNARAEANAAYYSAVAQAGVTEVSGAATAETDLFYGYGIANLHTVYNSSDPMDWLNLLSSADQAGQTADLSGLTAAFSAAVFQATLTRAGALGDAQIALAGGLGNAEVSYATSVGDAQLTAAGTLDGADSGYASAVAAAEEGQAAG